MAPECRRPRGRWLLCCAAALLRRSTAVALRTSEEQAARGANGIYFLHIPRTAGTSFATDAKKSLKTLQNAARLHYEVVDKEGCYDWHRDIEHTRHVAVMLREPRTHVLSQYIMCGEGPINTMTAVPSVEHGGFAEWLRRWQQLQNRSAVVGDFSRGYGMRAQMQVKLLVTYTSLPFHCYNPVSMQSQRLTCELPFKFRRRPDADRAITNMKEAWFVGLAEAYQESMCMFNAKVYGKLPKYCNCSDQQQWSSFRQTHTSYHDGHFRAGRIESQPQYVLDMIDELTAADRRLYREAVDRFLRDVQKVEKTFSTRLLCGNTSAKLLAGAAGPALNASSL